MECNYDFEGLSEMYILLQITQFSLQFMGQEQGLLL